jgi:phage recombination protein Bet
MSAALVTLTANLAAKFDISAENSKELVETLKNTAFKVKDGVVSDAQMTALMIVANQYNLNPWTREIFAYPDKGAIVPVVSVDGWSRIVNDNDKLDGIEFRYSEETGEHKGKIIHQWIECVITRKDRSKPTVVREYFDEVCRSVNFPTPWDTHPKRMHRHKALIQCARVAFGFGGIYDTDEAERIFEKDAQTGVVYENHGAEKKEPVVTVLPVCSEAAFKDIRIKNFEKVATGKAMPQKVIDFYGKKCVFTDEQLAEIYTWAEANEQN